MQTTFEAVSEDKPGIKWQHIFKRSWPAYKKWYFAQGPDKRPTYHSCLKSLNQHMPELIPVYQKLCELAGGGDLEARFLSLYNPPAYISGCSQIIWPGPNPVLIRNYDYSPALLDGMILKSHWLDQNVIAVSDCLIGVLDGINENGLCVSLTFGGSRQIGEGFGIPIILRYILETCHTSKQAQKVLQRMPTHMAYNVSVIDVSNNFFTAHLFPGKKPIIQKNTRIATNHQPFCNKWESYVIATATLEREKQLQHLLSIQGIGYLEMLRAFHQPPLYSTNYKKGFGTLYTSAYFPVEKILEVHWPDNHWIFGFQHFTHGQRVIQYQPSGAICLQSH